MTPAELNETSNEELFAIVDDAAGAGDASSSMEHQPFAPYVTLELLSRVHERVVQLKASRATTLSKHKLLA
ncbi:hypothetical protein AB1Y20_021399 [Prymnesium parvum]|uniref:Uncharacterized protein n=1 Tax=Prymnesium parvum TaxID=97485 RepID=A0AB34JIK5_PRYPA